MTEALILYIFLWFKVIDFCGRINAVTVPI